MATQGDRSLSAGMSFPKWMKTKINDRFDLEQNTFSPTELDESFMYYYRYNKQGKEGNATNVKLTDGKVVTSAQAQVSASSADFSKIAENSQRFIQKSAATEHDKIAEGAKQHITKPKGTDDGFKGEPATVGSSVVRVAHQMVSGKRVNTETPPEEQCEQLLAKFDPYRRRGSRSLPASPLTSPGSSPKTKRRGVNKYFTGAFTDTEKGKGWILSNLLAKRDLSQSVGFINEESKEELDRAVSALSIDEGSATKNNVFKAKPSELREMNFWSPTSM